MWFTSLPINHSKPCIVDERGGIADHPPLVCHVARAPLPRRLRSRERDAGTLVDRVSARPRTFPHEGKGAFLNDPKFNAGAAPIIAAR
jgi:hypothetical protein